MAFEVYELEKPDALLRVSLTGESNIYYTQLVKRRNEMQSGVIYVRASQDGTPTILFSDFPSPNVEVSYHVCLTPPSRPKQPSRNRIGLLANCLTSNDKLNLRV